MSGKAPKVNFFQVLNRDILYQAEQTFTTFAEAYRSDMNIF